MSVVIIPRLLGRWKYGALQSKHLLTGDDFEWVGATEFHFGEPLPALCCRKWGEGKGRRTEGGRKTEGGGGGGNWGTEKGGRNRRRREEQKEETGRGGRKKKRRREEQRESKNAYKIYI